MLTYRHQVSGLRHGATRFNSYLVRNDDRDRVDDYIGLRTIASFGRHTLHRLNDIESVYDLPEQ